MEFYSTSQSLDTFLSFFLLLFYDLQLFYSADYI